MSTNHFVLKFLYACKIKSNRDNGWRKNKFIKKHFIIIEKLSHKKINRKELDLKNKYVISF